MKEASTTRLYAHGGPTTPSRFTVIEQKGNESRSPFLLVLIQTTLFRKNAILDFLLSIGRMDMEYRITTRFGKKTSIHKVDAPNSTDAEKQLRLRRGEKIIDIERVKSSLDFDNGLGAPKYR